MRVVCKNCHESYLVGSIFGTRQLLLSYCSEWCAVADGLSAEDARVQIEQRVSLEELHERRRLFFATMRRPEMRLLRAAMKDLKWEHDIDWRDITSLEVHPPLTLEDRRYGPWMMIAGQYMSVCYNYDAPNPSFYVERLHDADDEFCECEWCKDSRLCYIRCKDVYIEQTAS